MACLWDLGCVVVQCSDLFVGLSAGPAEVGGWRTDWCEVLEVSGLLCCSDMALAVVVPERFWGA